MAALGRIRPVAPTARCSALPLVMLGERPGPARSGRTNYTHEERKDSP